MDRLTNMLQAATSMGRGGASSSSVSQHVAALCDKKLLRTGLQLHGYQRVAMLTKPFAIGHEPYRQLRNRLHILISVVKDA